MVTKEPNGRLLTRAQAAELLGMQSQTLGLWAHQRRGPKFLKLGKHGQTRYRLADIEAFMLASTVTTKDQK